MKKNIMILLIFLLLFTALSLAPCRAKEMVLTYEDMQKLDPGRTVYLAQILDDGNFLLLSKDPAGQDMMRLLLVSSSGRRLEKTDLPSSEIEYIQAIPGSEKILAYSQKRYAFYVLEMGRRNLHTIQSQNGSEPGFALFGGKKSKFFTAGKDILAWGYFYDKAGDFASEWIVRLNLGRQKQEFTQRIVEMSELLRQGREFSGIEGDFGFLDAGESVIAFTIADAQQGALLGYDVKNRKLFKIEEFAGFYGGDLSPDGKRVAYVIKPKGSDGQPVLFVYDIASRLPVMALPGDFLNPIFDMDGRSVAVGSPIFALGKVVATKISIIPLDKGNPRIAQIPAGGEIQDYRFVKKNRMVVVTKRGDIWTISY